jgi:HSP20 family protein
MTKQNVYSQLSSVFQDFDLLFSSVNDVLSDKYHFTSISDCNVRYPVFDQRFNEDEQQIIIAATGATKQDFQINLKDDVLSIARTNSNSNNDDEKFEYVKRNISKKKFDIAFKIPKKWDAENLVVKLENGELIITIPVKQDSKPKSKEFNID